MNSGKSHMLFSGNDNVSANIDIHTIISDNKNEPLGIILYSKLSFEDHINNLCKKASQKLNENCSIHVSWKKENSYESNLGISGCFITEVLAIKQIICMKKR